MFFLHHTLKAKKTSGGKTILVRDPTSKWGDGGGRHAPATLSSGKSTHTHYTGGEMGATTGVDGCEEEKLACPQPRFEPRIFHPLASPCTEYTIPAPMTRLPPE
jgi:hypothetical protein